MSKIPPGQPPTSSSRQATRNWFIRQLNPVQATRGELDLHTQAAPQRPRTAPSTGTATTATTMPPPIPAPGRHQIKAPSRPPRPNAGVVRDVNAWLDASKPTSPLMGGLAYWRDGAQNVQTAEPADVQYAIPIVQEPANEEPSPPSTQQLKSFCRRAKRMQVRMPSLHRTRSAHATVQKKLNRRSNSTPVMGFPSEETHVEYRPSFLARPESTRRPATATAADQTTQKGAWPLISPGALLGLPLRGPSATARPRSSESETERHVNAVVDRGARTVASLRPVPVAVDMLPREDSMGSISDAPTYLSGAPPPSYRSRAASILTTSSFGCIDGMNPEQRQLSQKRAQQKRGVKGKLKKLAQKCALTKEK